MKNKIDPKEWAEDFKLFMNAPEVQPPTHVRDEIFKFVHDDLNPKLWFVFGKLGAIHVVAGSLSLFLCVQFGMGRGYSLMNYFMGFGNTVCLVLCGAIFMGLTTLSAGFILSTPELRKIRKTGYSPVAGLGLISLLIFFSFGAEIATEVAIAWLFGAVMTGILVTETSLGFRRLIHH